MNKSKTVVQLLPELNEGGVERGTVELSRELVKRGYSSIVISNGGKLVKELEKDGAKHIKCDVCSKNILTAPLRINRLKKILKEINPDILHYRSRVPGWMVHFADKELGIPTVSTVHGYNSVSFYSKIMTKGDRVICVSNSIKEYIKKHYKTEESKITVIPRGVDLKKFDPNNLDSDFMVKFKKEFDLKDKFIISTVGRITQLKDLETFIKAIKLIQATLPNSIGLVVGGVREDKKEYFNSLKNLANSLKAPIKFTGSQSKVAEIYSLSDVVVSSSKKPESFGRSVAEALALNSPVVASKHGGVLDIILENKNGYFFKIGDEKELANNIIKAKKLKFDGFEYIKKHFSLEQMVDKTVEVYEKL